LALKTKTHRGGGSVRVWKGGLCALVVPFWRPDLAGRLPELVPGWACDRRMTYRVFTRTNQPKIQLKNVSHPPVVGKLADSLP
jgi:hypothetical protein